MLPYSDIWESLSQIQGFEIDINLRRTKNECGLTLEQIIEKKNLYMMETIIHAEYIDQLMSDYNNDIDFTYRYKEDQSIARNWEKEMSRPLYKILNDLLGMRFVIKTNSENLKRIVTKFVLECPFGDGKCRYTFHERDGYKGIHVYLRRNNRVFPIEVQFWTRPHALLNAYLRDNIYTITDEASIIEYANNLREWLESIPPEPQSERPILSYVDYLYEKVFP